jgi:hypothetical protein
MTVTARASALEILLERFGDHQSYKIFDLLDVMERDGFSDSDVKEAVAKLLHEHRIELTSDRRLRSATAA